MIKISVPNDDHVALRAMAKALEEIAVARGAPVHDEALQQLHNNIQISVSELLKKNPGKVAHTDEVAEFVKQTGAHALAEALNNGQEIGALDVTTDSTGTPWDERIHSASKALNADGTWRLRRKPKDMDEVEWSEFVQNVQYELLGQKPDELDEALEEHDALVNVTTEGDDFHTDTGVVTEQQVASFPPPPPVPQLGRGSQSTPYKLVGAGDDLSSGAGVTPQTTTMTVASGGGAPVMTFPQVMAFLTERHGRVTSAQVDQIIADMGLEKITDLNTKPEHTGPFIARVKALLGE